VQAADLTNRDFKKILLIKLSAIGDVIHTIPVLNKLRQRYPNARIDWLVTSGIAELLRHNPAISNVIEFSRDEWSAPWRLTPFLAGARLIATLRAAEYDLVVDLQGQFRSAVFAFASGAPVRIGFGKPRDDAFTRLARVIPQEARKHAWRGAREGAWLAYTHSIDLPTLDIHPVERYLRIGTILGLDGGPPDFSFPIPPAANTRIDALFDYYDIGKAKLVAIAPGTNWETKQWHSGGFAEAARHFLQDGFAVWLIGSDRERPLCAAVAKLAPGAINLAGETSLSELAALISRTALCVTNDSGPMHLAVALGRSVVSVFGPTDPIWAGPYRQPASVVRAGVPCSPCYLRRLSQCPNSHACMEAISATDVIGRARSGELMKNLMGGEQPVRPRSGQRR
jgi:lipopolysaccharide heptosyltransferase I